MLPPDVNVSELAFGAVEGKIRFGLGAIKGVGESAIEAILEARKRAAPSATCSTSPSAWTAAG